MTARSSVRLCPHRCKIADGKTGICRSRRNKDGVLISEVYGKPCSLAIDPIEKKPLYHFHPGTTCLSVACTGCNFRCLNCQNHEISQVAPAVVGHYDLTPRQIVEPLHRASQSGHRLHLHRAADLSGVYHRHCPSGSRSRTMEHPRYGGLCLPGASERPPALSRCC